MICSACNGIMDETGEDCPHCGERHGGRPTALASFGASDVGTMSASSSGAGTVAGVQLPSGFAAPSFAQSVAPQPLGAFLERLPDPEEFEISDTLPVGATLQGGTYVIVRIIGQGGFGVTYLANDTKLMREVAIKEFLPYNCTRRGGRIVPSRLYNTDDFSKDRVGFVDEARTLAQFNHPNIVEVYTFFEENNTAYMVMEFLQGRTLHDIVNNSGPLPEAHVVEHGVKISEALEVVHATSLLHRDIKPQNIFLTNEGRPVLLDFGIARKFVGDRDVTHSTVLTMGYAPPEQYVARARRGPPSDIYALGATLYFAVSGKVPPSASDRCLQNIQVDPPRNASPRLRDAIMWAMEIKAEQRPQNVRQFMGALQTGIEPAQRSAMVEGARTMVAAEPFRFKSAQAATLVDLARLCDLYADEARLHLDSGELERWLAQQLGETPLARHLRTLRENGDPQHALELAIREVGRAAGQDLRPHVAVHPASISMEVPVGSEASRRIDLQKKGRGSIWGTARLDPPHPALGVTAVFEDGEPHLDVTLDARSAAPAAYAGSVVVDVFGLAQPLRIPLEARILEVTVHVEPYQLDLGGLPYGTVKTASLRLRCDPPSAQLQLDMSVNDTAGEIILQRPQAASPDEVRVVIRTRRVDAGRAYQRMITLQTNFGPHTVPVRFEVVFRQTAFWLWTIGAALLCGALLGAARSMLARNVDAGWLTTWSAHGDMLWTWFGFGVAAVVGLMAWVRMAEGSSRRKLDDLVARYRDDLE